MAAEVIGETVADRFEIVLDGQPVTLSKRIAVRAGEEKHVLLEFSGATAARP